MKKIILASFILFLLVGVGICSQEPPPPAAQGQMQSGKLDSKASTKSNIKTKDSNNKSPNSISPINKTNTGKEDNATQNSSKPTNEGQFGAVKDDPITRYTFWLMVFTGLLVVCNFFLWLCTKKAADTAKKAADVAEIGARAVIRMELPVIRAIRPDLIIADNLTMEDKPWYGTVNNGLPTKFSFVLMRDFKNSGRSPAFPKSISVGLMVANRLPDQPRYSKSFILSHASVIKPDDEFHNDVYCGTELTDNELQGIGEGRIWLWFYGCLYYRDFMNEGREYRFCWRYANQTPRQTPPHYGFSSDGNPPEECTKNV